MKKLVALALLLSFVSVPVFGEDSSSPACSEEVTCGNSSCTCKQPCECDPCICEDMEEETIVCCSKEDCDHGQPTDHNRDNK